MKTHYIHGLKEYEYNSGKILLEDERYVLMGANALGTLKRDLIFALGIERTKGFMLRYGYNCGSDYAKKLKEVYPNKTKNEWFQIGPNLHSQMGTANVIPTHIIYKEATDDYFAEGYWSDSYEAEQHLKYFGFSDESVCYIAAGFAGGYISELLGRKVICKEITCKGKGDLNCQWIIKPLEDWDETVKQDLHFYAEENLDKELDRAYKRIEKQKMTLQKVLELNEELSRSVIKDNTLASIIKVIGENLNVGILMEDQYFNTIESFGLKKEYEILDYIKAKKRSKTLLKLTEEFQTISLSITNEFINPHERLVTPILINNRVFGYISLIKDNGNFSEAEFLSLQRTASMCSIKILNDMATLEVEQRMVGNFLDELLSDHAQELNLNYRMKLYGYNLNIPHYILLLNMIITEDSVVKDIEEYRINFQKQTIDIISHFLNIYGHKCMVTVKLNQIVILIPKDIAPVENIKTIAESLVKQVEKKFTKVQITIGVSSLCNQLKDYKRGYDEARKAIQISKLKSERNKIVLFEELGLFSRIFGTDNLDDLKATSINLLKDLIAYDEKHGADLIQTLHQYLMNQGNIHKTARKMNISVGSTRYRLKRIYEISNINVSNPNDFYEVHLALQVLIFLDLIKI